MVKSIMILTTIYASIDDPLMTAKDLMTAKMLAQISPTQFAPAILLSHQRV